MKTITKLPGGLLIGLGGLLVASLIWAADEPIAAQPSITPERLARPGVENLFRLSPRLYSGSQPEGEAGFATLQELGVKTIVSVDGSLPDVEAAKRLGFRYVHLPIGYGGIPREQAVRLVQAAKLAPGPVFVHCHHGKHRGPAVAALCGLTTEGWTKDQARAWLGTAGTSPEYRGLFAAVDQYTPPTADEIADAGDAFPERTAPPALVEAMVQIDLLLDRLKAARAVGFQVPPKAPDVDPPHEALQLAEQFREAARLDESKDRGEGFLHAFETAEQRADALASSLKRLADQPADEPKAQAETAFAAVVANCSACHAEHRDR